jgi:ABC-type uncharacterized transport system auxiliary subunit
MCGLQRPMLVARSSIVLTTCATPPTPIMHSLPMLGGRMAEWLDRSGPFSAVAPPGSAQPAPYVLEATVEELYGDFRAGRPPAAVLSVQFALIGEASARPKVVYERTFATRVNLSKASPDALVGGYGTALAEILSQVAPDLSAWIEH